MDNLKILLRGISHGDTEVLVDPAGNYHAMQVRGARWLPDGIEVRDILSRIQYELYGEYPLSSNNQSDWDRNMLCLFKAGHSSYIER